MLIDLQLHSTYSDGYLTPTEVAKFIAEKGIKIAALTDHNTVGGLDEFRQACKRLQIKPITGIELYINLDQRRINLLWFNFNDQDPEFHKVLRNSQIRRKNKVRKILKELTKRGLKINITKTLDKYTHYVPLNHLIDDFWAVPHNRALIKKKLKSQTPREGEIIGQYFRNGNFGKLHESYIDIKRIILLRKKIGGQLILNHPGKHNQLKKELLVKLKELGIDGIEVLSPHHTIGATMYAQYLAQEFNFIATGGSDFHRHEGENYPLQNSLEYFRMDSQNLKRIKEIIG